MIVGVTFFGDSYPQGYEPPATWPYLLPLIVVAAAFFVAMAAPDGSVIGRIAK